MDAGANELLDKARDKAGELLEDSGVDLNETLGDGATDNLKKTLDEGLGSLLGGEERKER